MAGWNFADIWEVVAEQVPDAPAQVQGERRISWSEFDRRADGVAQTLLDAGVRQHDKVAQYLTNCPEYLESVFGAWKIGMVPVNTNYRYTDDELAYLWDNADAVAVVFHGTFAERAEAVRSRVPNVRTWLWVDDGSGPCPDWAVPYENAAKAATARVAAPWGRSGDDIYMLYTGGTTGMPKGVMWRQHDLFSVLNASAIVKVPQDGTLEDVRQSVTAPGAGHLPACPLMHGTGALTSFSAMASGGRVISLANRSFDAVELFDTVEREKANIIVIVGDVFAKPMVAALDAQPGRWDLSSVFIIISSGVMWSEPVKQGLLRHNPNMMLIDSLGSSEAVGMGNSVSSGSQASRTAKFELGESAIVITDDGRRVEPGSGELGRVAVRGHVPVGYYKDPEKTARTFPVVDGVRYSVPGDYATVEADGTLTLFGRGSQTINTGGEKVYSEEVEETLKEYPGVGDAVVVGVPDERFGEAVTALVEPVDGATVAEAEIIAHVKTRLAAYKAPKRVFVVGTIGRSPNGKIDYKRVKAEASSLSSS